MADHLRCVHHGPDGKRTESKDAPKEMPSGLLSIIGEGFAATVHNGTLYINGQEAPPGLRRLAFRDGTLPIAIKAGGRVEFRSVEPKGGK